VIEAFGGLLFDAVFLARDRMWKWTWMSNWWARCDFDVKFL